MPSSVPSTVGFKLLRLRRWPLVVRVLDEIDWSGKRRGSVLGWSRNPFDPLRYCGKIAIRSAVNEYEGLV